MGEVTESSEPNNKDRNRRHQYISLALQANPGGDVVNLARRIESYVDGSEEKPKYSTPDDAPEHTIAFLGSPQGKAFIIKTTYGFWRYVDSGAKVDPADFLSGWFPQ